MNIALYGGKFDPPHVGHLNVALQALKNIPHIDQLWLIPAKTHQWRNVYASGTDRLAMLKTFGQYDKRIKVSDIELQRPRPTITIDTVKEFKKKYPKHTFCWVMGSDNVATFSRWDDYKELQKLVPFWIYPRPGYQIKKLPKNFYAIPNYQTEVKKFSSTGIRKKINQGLAVDHMLTPEVYRYIVKKQLY